jgi:LytS/YehU family sensor histidine kinase
MSGKALVPLAEELELCRQHLEVMSYRKGSTFTLVSRVNAAQRVPPAIFHTLIENALTHNAYAGGAVFGLEAAEAANGRRVYRLRSPLQRSDSERGSAVERGRRRGEGTGHAYVKARLQEAFGDAWSFTAGPDGGEWLDTIETPKA